MTYIPNQPNLNQISTNDFVNYKGVRYAVNNVVSTKNNGDGTFAAVIQISVVTTNDTTLNLSSADTVNSAYWIDQAGVQHAKWDQTVKA